VWGVFAIVITMGCNPLSTIAFLTSRDAKEEAKHPLTFKEGPKKDKAEIVVALFVSQNTGQSFDFSLADGVIASEMAKRLPELAKLNKQKLIVIAPSEVNKFKIKNPDWKVMHQTTWGKKLGADFVLAIHVEKMELYQPGSLKQIYEGRAEVTVDTFDVDAGVGEPKSNYIYPFSYPKTVVRDVGSMPQGTFKKAFLENLAEELAMQHIDHKASSGIADGR